MTPAPLVAAARPTRFRRAGFLLALALLVCSAPPASAQSVVDPDLDSDGDGIVNAFDPDDDNDGVTDDIDSAPFNASIPSSAPPPSSIDPDTDSDGDGIANSHDPDDDQDGWVDASDPVVFDPDNTVPAPDGGGGGGGTQGGGSVGSAESTGSAGSIRTPATSTTSTGSNTGTGTRQGGARVTALPKTGAGSLTITPPTDGVVATLVLAACLLAFSAFALHVTAHSKPVAIRRHRLPVLRR